MPKEELEFFGPYAEEYRKAWESAVDTLKNFNLPIEYIDYSLFSEAVAILYDGPWVAERWADLGDFIETHPGAAFPVTEKILRSGANEKHTAASVFNALHKLQKFKSQAAKTLEGAVMVMPTCGGTWTREQVRQEPIVTNSAMGLYTNNCNLLDLCAVAVPAGEAVKDVPFGITLFALSQNEDLICGAAKLFTEGSIKLVSTKKEDTTLVAVCGLHMRGFPLEKQMQECGAKFIKKTLTAPKYQFVKLPTTSAKPGLIKRQDGGSSIQIEI